MGHIGLISGARDVRADLDVLNKIGHGKPVVGCVGVICNLHNKPVTVFLAYLDKWCHFLDLFSPNVAPSFRDVSQPRTPRILHDIVSRVLKGQFQFLTFPQERYPCDSVKADSENLSQTRFARQLSKCLLVHFKNNVHSNDFLGCCSRRSRYCSRHENWFPTKLANL